LKVQFEIWLNDDPTGRVKSSVTMELQGTYEHIAQVLKVLDQKFGDGNIR
jgi:hypothetical protein